MNTDYSSYRKWPRLATKNLLPQPKNYAYLAVLESAILPVRRSNSAHFEIKHQSLVLYIKRR